MNIALSLNKIDDSKLFSVYKEKKLKGPNAIAYDAATWRDAFEAISNKTTRDQDLLKAALHLGEEFQSLRSHMKGKLPRLAPLDALDLVVAAINVQTITTRSRTEAKLIKQLRRLGVGYIGDTGSIRVRSSGNQDLNPDDS